MAWSARTGLSASSTTRINRKPQACIIRTQLEGLSSTRAASGSKYYIGGTYQYQNIAVLSGCGDGLAAQTQTQTQTIFLFLSVYLKPKLSLSLSGGPQHYKATQASLPASASWAPMTIVSLGWQGERTTLAASYTRTASGGGGLNGAFHSNNATASATWQMSRTWNVGISGAYSNYKTLTPLFVQVQLWRPHNHGNCVSPALAELSI